MGKKITEKIRRLNGTSLKDLGVTSADLNYWTYWGRASVALSGIEVQTITIEEGCQFPSMAFAENGTPSRYVNKESVTYYAVGDREVEVLDCKKGATVTFDGQEVTAYVDMAIPTDVIPANPTKESDESYTYTFDGWYNGETKWNIEGDVVTGDIALVSKFTQALREYTVTFVADGATVGTATYTVEDKDIEEPAVPEKEGYTGAWEAYELTTGDITVNAVYTEVEAPIDPPTSEPDEPADSSTSEPTTSEPDEPADSSTSEPTTSEPTTSEHEAEKKGGCGSVIGGVSAALALVAAAAVVLKKKED